MAKSNQKPEPDDIDEALENQDEDEPVEIRKDGSVVPPGSTSNSGGKKPLVLGDPKGEFGENSKCQI